MNIKVEFSNPDWNKIRRELDGNIEREVTRKIQRVRCPTHGKTPRVRFSKVGTKMTWTIDACCDEASQLALRAVD